MTQNAWDRVGGEDNREWRGEKLPIEEVSWNACKAWLEKAGDGLRLLSEAEWEYACRAGAQTDLNFGDDIAKLDQYAWYSKNSNEQTYSVAQKIPNAFGLYDMHGNVWEWCQDWYVDSYEKVPRDHTPI